MQGKIYQRNSKLIRQKYLEYLIPSMLTSSAFAVAGVVDGAIVGSLLGSVQLAAVGACIPVVLIINAIFRIFSSGGATRAAVALGERDIEGANRYFSVSMLSGLAVAFFFVLIVEVMAKPVSLWLARGNSELSREVLEYVRSIVFACPLLIASLGMSMFMQIEGYVKAASSVAVIANIVNLILDYVLIKYTRIGIAGASLSTVLGYLCGTLPVLWWLHSGKRTFKLVNPFSKQTFRALLEVLSTGRATFLLDISVFASRLLLNVIAFRYFGVVGLSVSAMCYTLFFFATSINDGCSNAFLPIVGVLYGERDYFDIRSCARTSFAYVLCGTGLLLTLMEAAPDFAANLYGMNDSETLGISIMAIRLVALSIPLKGVNTIFQTLYNSTGHTRLSSLMNVSSGALFSCLFGILLPLIDRSLFWLSYAFAEGVTLLVVIVGGFIAGKREHLSGVFLLKPIPEGVVIEHFTVEADPEAAAAISRKIGERATEIGLNDVLAIHMSVAVEEMVMAVYESEGKRRSPLVDVMLVKDEEGVMLSFRENGKPCNLLMDDPKNPREVGNGISVFTSMARSTEYSHQLGFNNIVARFI